MPFGDRLRTNESFLILQLKDWDLILYYQMVGIRFLNRSCCSSRYSLLFLFISFFPLTLVIFFFFLIKLKGKESLLQLYDGDLVNALMDVYPEIGLEKAKFLHQSRMSLFFSSSFIFFYFNSLLALGSTWQDETQRRLFFEQFALLNDFDHTNKENWYHLPRAKLKSFKVCWAERSKKIIPILIYLIRDFTQWWRSTMGVSLLPCVPYFQKYSWTLVVSVRQPIYIHMSSLSF